MDETKSPAAIKTFSISPVFAHLLTWWESMDKGGRSLLVCRLLDAEYQQATKQANWPEEITGKLDRLLNEVITLREELKNNERESIS